jgi:hypothetical protein
MTKITCATISTHLQNLDALGLMMPNAGAHAQPPEHDVNCKDDVRVS